MSQLSKEIVSYTVIIITHIDAAKTERDELRFNSVLQILTQAQVLVEKDENQARKLLSMAKTLAKLRARGKG